MNAVRRLVLAAVALAAAAPSAAALPGDPPLTALTPGPGAAVPASADGIAVTFTCPAYRIFDLGDGFASFGGVSSYGVALATAPDLGTDGRLRADRVVARADASAPNTLPAGECRSVLGDGRATGPQATPGTYHWQAYRLCTGCAGGYEVTEVRPVVVRGAATLRVLPRVAFAGFPAPFQVRAAGLPDGVEVRLQRQRPGGWATIGTGVARDGRADVIGTLRAGSNRLRALAVTGADTVVSPLVTVAGRPGTRRSTSAADDGGYAAAAGSGVSMRVTGGGRFVRRGSIRVLMVCPTVPAPGSIGGQVITQTGFAQVTSAPIAPDGTFVAVAVSAGSSVLVRGRVTRGRVVGGVAKLSIGTCSGTATFTARRATR